MSDPDERDEASPNGLSLDRESWRGFRQALERSGAAPAEPWTGSTAEPPRGAPRYLADATVDLSAVRHWSPGLRGFAGRSLADLQILGRRAAADDALPPVPRANDRAEPSLGRDRTSDDDALLAEALSSGDLPEAPPFEADEPEGPPQKRTRERGPEAEAEIARVRSLLERMYSPQDGGDDEGLP